jgi:hypothetical protein
MMIIGYYKQAGRRPGGISMKKKGVSTGKISGGSGSQYNNIGNLSEKTANLAGFNFFPPFNICFLFFSKFFPLFIIDFPFFVKILIAEFTKAI